MTNLRKRFENVRFEKFIVMSSFRAEDAIESKSAAKEKCYSNSDDDSLSKDLTTSLSKELADMVVFS